MNSHDDELTRKDGGDKLTRKNGNDKLTRKNGNDKLARKSVDEKLTRENVEEQIEQSLTLLQEPQTPAMTSLSHTIQDLQGIYEEDRRLEHIWARINSRVSALNAVRIIRETEGLSNVLLAQSVLQKTRRTEIRSQRQLRLSCLIVGIVLIVVMMLTAFFTWLIWSQFLHGLQPQFSMNKGTPQTQPPVNGLNITDYVGPYFKLQYPINWVISSGTVGSSSLQTVQFRPSATSSVCVKVDAMPANLHSPYQQLEMDTDMKLGTMQSTSSVTSHGHLGNSDILIS